MMSQNIDHQKDQFALEISAQVMDRIKTGRFLMPECQIKAQIQLLILDAVEFGIQLGGMAVKENCDE